MTAKTTLAKDKIKSNYSGIDHYDLVIIGAGISGLATALMWLKNTEGKKTLIIDKNSYVGGYSTTFKRGEYVFETTQLFPDIIEMMEYLGLEIELKKFEKDFMRRIVVHGDEVDEYKIPAGSENFTRYLKELFPDDAEKIDKLMKYSTSMFSQVRKLKVIPTLKDTFVTPFKAPKVIANLSRTYSQLLDKFGITNPKLREVMETFTSFSGVPSDRASSIYATGAMLSSMTRCFRPYGYFDEFPANMATLFQEWGGELLLGAGVEKIVVEDGKATGVMIKGNDSMIKADTIITTIDPMLAMHQLVGDENLPEKYLQRLDKIVMSTSSINIALGLDDKIDLSVLDLDYPYNVVSTGLGTSEKLFEGFMAGDNAFSEDCFHAAVICPSLTTGAKNTVTIRCTPFALGKWLEWRNNDPEKYKAEKERWGDFFIAIAEKYFIPDLSKHIVVKDIATPATYSRYSGSPTGSIYDMASIVTQFGPKRLPFKTPIENLYQPKFAHGLYGSMMNGVQMVDMLLNREFNDGNSLFTAKNK
ncbi:MAG: NAD(P)/FAD-dependent oxidoreductase [Bacteroidales bacterium]|nr:NAD(P)/FAD-dependent oxidoreductase [Bacteroidales bacterium]